MDYISIPIWSLDVYNYNTAHGANVNPIGLHRDRRPIVRIEVDDNINLSSWSILSRSWHGILSFGNRITFVPKGQFAIRASAGFDPADVWNKHWEFTGRVDPEDHNKPYGGELRGIGNLFFNGKVFDPSKGIAAIDKKLAHQLDLDWIYKEATKYDIYKMSCKEILEKYGNGITHVNWIENGWEPIEPDKNNEIRVWCDGCGHFFTLDITLNQPIRIVYAPTSKRPTYEIGEPILSKFYNHIQLDPDGNLRHAISNGMSEYGSLCGNLQTQSYHTWQDNKE